MKSLIVSILAGTALSLSAITAEAQTANGSPTAPANGSAGAVSTAGPSVGGATSAPQTSKVPGQTLVEKKEQESSDKVMNICKGC